MSTTIKINLKIDSIKLKITNLTSDSNSEKNPFDVELPLPPPAILHLYKSIDSLNSSLELVSKERKSISNFNEEEILIKLILLVLLIVYPLRGLILLIKWSLRTIKE